MNLENVINHPYLLIKEFENQFTDPHGHLIGVFATIQDNKPKSRNIILREYEMQNKILSFYAHSKSKKIKQLRENPHCNIVWYEKNKMLQIIFYGKAICHVDGKKLEQAMKHINPHNEKDYLATSPGDHYSRENSENLHFALIEFKIEEIDALLIGKSEHLRFKFQPIATTPEGEQEFKATRLTP